MPLLRAYVIDAPVYDADAILLYAIADRCRHIIVFSCHLSLFAYYATLAAIADTPLYFLLITCRCLFSDVYFLIINTFLPSACCFAASLFYADTFSLLFTLPLLRLCQAMSFSYAAFADAFALPRRLLMLSCFFQSRAPLLAGVYMCAAQQACATLHRPLFRCWY